MIMFPRLGKRCRVLQDDIGAFRFSRCLLSSLTSPQLRCLPAGCSIGHLSCAVPETHLQPAQSCPTASWHPSVWPKHSSAGTSPEHGPKQAAEKATHQKASSMTADSPSRSGCNTSGQPIKTWCLHQHLVNVLIYKHSALILGVLGGFAKVDPITVRLMHHDGWPEGPVVGMQQQPPRYEAPVTIQLLSPLPWIQPIPLIPTCGWLLCTSRLRTHVAAALGRKAASTVAVNKFLTSGGIICSTPRENKQGHMAQAQSSTESARGLVKGHECLHSKRAEPT